MKKALDNSCFKGCFVYLFVLVAIMTVSMVGINSLGSMLGLGKHAPKLDITGMTLPQQPEAAATQLAQIGNLPQQLAPLLPTIAVTTEQIQQAAQAIEAGKNLLPTIQAQVQAQIPAQILTQIPAQISSQIQTQIPAQIPVQAPARATPQTQPKSDGISGQATAPFYIVQSGDTLWSIANKFSATVDTLKAANRLTDNLIKPGQLLYLPQP